ncbi:MAG: glycosyltransferase family 9 protein [Succinivibrio sp.]
MLSIVLLSLACSLLLIAVVVLCLVIYRINRDLCEKVFSSLRTVGLVKTVKKIIHYRQLKRLPVEEVDDSNWIEYDDAISVALRLTGGFGDYIISAKVIEELLRIATCKLVIYAEKQEFANAVYCNYPNTTLNFKDQFFQEASKYDLALDIGHFVECFNYRKDKVKLISEELAKRIDYLIENYNKIYVDIEQQWYRERLRFEKCRLEGLDRWTELRMGKTFEIADKKINLPLLSDHRNCLEQLGLTNKQYITINYGADAMRVGLKQLKLWPKDNLEKFISLFHAKYPSISIVQLGAKNAEKISGANLYVLGESIENTKWILKQSSLHVDCEGGLVHLATQLDTKCVVLFGPTPVHMYGYKQNINIHNDECDYCMGLTRDWAYECFKGYCECNCLRNISPELVMSKIAEEQLF